MKPKRCLEHMNLPQRRPLILDRCTLELGHTGDHTLIPPSGMDYAPDDEPGIEPPTESDDKFQSIRHFAMKIASRMHDGECPSYYDKVQFIEGQVNWLYTTISELRDAKMALLLIVDDCHRIMEERANKIDELQNAKRDLHIKLHDLELEKDEEIRAIKVRVTDTEYAWHDLALAAKEYMEAEGAGGTFDAGRVRETRARLKELTENPE